VALPLSENHRTLPLARCFLHWMVQLTVNWLVTSQPIPLTIDSQDIKLTQLRGNRSMLVTSSFIILCAAFVGAPLVLYFAGVHIIREDDRQVAAAIGKKEMQS
jgi:hypothetical protein